MTIFNFQIDLFVQIAIPVTAGVQLGIGLTPTKQGNRKSRERGSEVGRGLQTTQLPR